MRFLFFASIFCLSFAQELQASPVEIGNIYYFDPASGIEFFDNNECMFFNCGTSLSTDFKEAPFRYTYRIDTRDGVSFIEFADGSNVQKYLVLANKDLFILYDENQTQLYKIGFRNFGVMESFDFLSEDKVIETSSELREYSTAYKAENLRKLDLDSPWAEGSTGDGVGETITIRNWTSQRMILFSGFLSYKKPYLYCMNSRPKKISISFTNMNTIYTYDLLDTPNPQIIDMNNGRGDIIITILEVYPGMKYSDLCIHAIASQ